MRLWKCSFVGYREGGVLVGGETCLGYGVWVIYS